MPNKPESFKIKYMTGFEDTLRKVNSISLDFCNALNTVSHDILIFKLGHYSLDGQTNRWVKTCLMAGS